MSHRRHGSRAKPPIEPTLSSGFQTITSLKGAFFAETISTAVHADRIYGDHRRPAFPSPSSRRNAIPGGGGRGRLLQTSRRRMAVSPRLDRRHLGDLASRGERPVAASQPAPLL